MDFEGITNERLLANLRTFTGCERRLVVKVVEYLGEVEARRLHLELACPSMHDFCTRHLGFSEGATHRRLTAARLVRIYPQLIEPLRDGRLLLSNLVLLRDHFKNHDVAELIGAASNKTSKQVEELVARLAPKRDVPSSIQPVQEQPSLLAITASAAGERSTTSASRQVTPLSPERFQVTFTAGVALRDKLDRARDLTRHRNPTGDLELIVERGMDLLIEALEKERFGTTARPRKSRGPHDPADVSAATRREVSVRDNYQCTFRSVDGERCPARGFLELDHEQPRARGGAGDTANIRLRCRSHNQLEAERVFGRAHVEQQIQARRDRLRENANANANANVNVNVNVNTETNAKSGASVEVIEAKTERLASRVEVREPEAAAWKPPPFEVARAALVGMGFRNKDVERALSEMTPQIWGGPIEVALREAIGRLT